MKQPVHKVMTSLEKVFSLSADAQLDFDTVSKIFQSGFSRIPVFEPDSDNDIIGILYTKDLILLDPDDRMTVRRVLEFFHRDRVEKVWSDESLQEVLQTFKHSKTHLALVQHVNNTGDVCFLQFLSWDQWQLLPLSFSIQTWFPGLYAGSRASCCVQLL